MTPAVTRETRFSELPQSVKQKIINIHRSSHQQYASTEPLKITKFNHLYSQTQDLQTRNLQRNFRMVAENAERLKQVWESGKSQDFKYMQGMVKQALDEFREDVVLYKKSEGNREFVDELAATYGMLRNKAEMLCRERRMQ